jgi:hypothetical protein
MFSGFGLTQNLWEPGLPAMAILWALSSASRILHSPYFAPNNIVQ